MKVVFSNKYLDSKSAILDFLNNFNEGGQTIKKDRNVIKIFKVGDTSINIKSFKRPNFINAIVYRYFRKSKAERSFEYANILLEKEIGTPFPIAYIEERTLFGLVNSYYISEHIATELTYRDLVQNENLPDRNKILKEFTIFTYKLHENNVLFKDHSPGNTLIEKQENHYAFYLVDLNRMVFKPLTFEERIKNFSRLTPKKEMVAQMSETYAAISPWDYETIFKLMWEETSQFQKRFFRKKRLKKQYLFKKN